jgi:multiple sugar transport system substrate-binding protein
VLDLIARKYTVNVGYPGFSNAAIDEIFNTSVVPQMFAQVAQGKMTPAEGGERGTERVQADLRQVEGPGEDLVV